MVTIARGALVDAAKDLNKVLELSPAIDVKKGVKELRADVLEAASLLKDKDPISKETRAALDALGRGGDEGEKGPEVSSAPKPAKAPKTEGEKASTAAPKPRKPHEAANLGEFKPIRHGSRMHKFAVMAHEGKTLDEIAAASGRADFAAKDVRWWLCQYLRRHHGIAGTVDDGGKVKLAFPAGKKLDDCVSKAAA